MQESNHVGQQERRKRCGRVAAARHGAARGARAGRDGGFTLLEILVSLIILSGLLAVLFPVVMDQVSRGEPTRTAADLSAVASALSMFRANVLTVPDDLEDLANPITAADRQISGEPYSVSQLERWRGPYIDVPMVEAGPADVASPDSLETGYKGFILPVLALFDGAANDSVPLVEAQNANFAAVMVSGLSDEEFEDLNDVVDGVAELDGWPGCSLCSWDRGKLRRQLSDGVTYFLVMPYRSY